MTLGNTIFKKQIRQFAGSLLLLLGLLCNYSESKGQAFYAKAHMMQIDAGWWGKYKQVTVTSVQDSMGRKLRSYRLLSNSYGIHYEYGVKEWRKEGALSVGLYAGMRKIDARVPNNTKPISFREVWLRYYQFAIESKYHFYTKDRWDPYINAMIGVQLRNYSLITVANTYPTVNPQKKNPKLTLAAEASFGARYYLYNNVSVFGEVGYGIYVLKIGLNVIVKP